MPSRASSLSQLERFPPRLQRSHSLECVAHAPHGHTLQPPRRMYGSMATGMATGVATGMASSAVASSGVVRSASLETLHAHGRGAHGEQHGEEHDEEHEEEHEEPPPPQGETSLARLRGGDLQREVTLAAQQRSARAGRRSPKMSRSSSTLSVDEQLSLNNKLRSSASKLKLEAAVAAAIAVARPAGASTSSPTVVQSL